MRIARKFHRPMAAAVATAALLQVQVAQAAAPVCITEQEVSAMAAFSMSSVLEGTMNSCRPHLAANGYFATSGQQLIGRYAARKAAAWPGAKSAFLKFGSEKDPEMLSTVGSLPDAALQPFVDAMLSEMVASKIKPAQCRPVERMAMLLSPLPPENMADIIGYVIALAGDKPAKAGTPRICPAQS